MLYDARARNVRYTPKHRSARISVPQCTDARFEKNVSTLSKNFRNDSPSAAAGAIDPSIATYSGQKSGIVSASFRGSDTRFETMITTASSGSSFHTERTTWVGTST